VNATNNIRVNGNPPLLYKALIIWLTHALPDDIYIMKFVTSVAHADLAHYTRLNAKKSSLGVLHSGISAHPSALKTKILLSEARFG
jgi:hypothetical protein